MYCFFSYHTVQRFELTRRIFLKPRFNGGINCCLYCDEVPLQQAYGGDFVIVNEALYDQLANFKK